MDGFINLDKESGMSSHQAVAAIRRLLNCKAGHCGTLDPSATGVLPLCLNKATRLAEYITGQPKIYTAIIRFGLETDSYDAAGNVTKRQNASHLRQHHIEALLPRFCGEIWQFPPLISAIKLNGLPLYKRARRNERPELNPRLVRVDALEFCEGEFNSPTPWAKIRIACGKGFYVRSFAHDLGELLDVGAHVAALRRLAVGQFTADTAYTIAQIEAMLIKGDSSFLLPLSYGLTHLPVFIAPPDSLFNLVHGNDWQLKQAQALPLCRVETVSGDLVGIGRIDPSEQGGYILHMDKVIESNPAILSSAYSVIAIGNFDGLHLGHQELLRRMSRHKERLGGKSAVLTFKPHPLRLINGKTPPLLNTAEEKRLLIMQKGCADALIELHFNEELRSSDPKTFVDQVIVGRTDARQVVVGFNFRFGANGAGNAQLLRELCAARGIDVEIVEAVRGAYGLVSSSNIRQYLQAGNMTAVHDMLGYTYNLSGQVEVGNKLGRQLGFATANFLPPPKALPPCGVYAGQAKWQGQLFKAIINLGYKPTVDSTLTQPLVEVHLFDVEPLLYGERITVYFAHFLRKEQQFANIEELKAQINTDCQAARQYLNTQKTTTKER